MSPLKLLVIGLVIGSNNLAAALTLGAFGQAEHRWRAVVVFGAFEFSVPLIGIWLGQSLATRIEAYVSWIGAALIMALGLWSLASAFRTSPGSEKMAERLTTWSGLVLLEAGLCLDNLVAGFSLGLRNVEPFVLASTIAIFSMSYTWIGMKLGDKAHRHWEKYAKGFAGIALICLAAAMWADWI